MTQEETCGSVANHHSDAVGFQIDAIVTAHEGIHGYYFDHIGAMEAGEFLSTILVRCLHHIAVPKST